MGLWSVTNCLITASTVAGTAADSIAASTGIDGSIATGTVAAGATTITSSIAGINVLWGVHNRVGLSVWLSNWDIVLNWDAVGLLGNVYWGLDLLELKGNWDWEWDGQNAEFGL